MVGGIVTLATLTGTGAAFTTAGLLTDDGGASSVMAKQDAQLSAAANELVSSEPETLRATLAGMLSILAVQDGVRFGSTRSWTTAVISEALSLATTQMDTHARIAPDSIPAKAWAKRVRLLERAMRHVHKPDSERADRTESVMHQPAIEGRLEDLL